MGERSSTSDIPTPRHGVAAALLLIDAIASLAEAPHVAALQDGLVQWTAKLLSANVVVLVAKNAVGCRALATHGLPAKSEVVPAWTTEVAALARELGQPVIWQAPPIKDAGLPRHALALPLVVGQGQPLMLCCHRTKAFTERDRDNLAAFLRPIPGLWRRAADDAVLRASMRQHAMEVAQLVERLAVGERIQANFLATISHELRTPLNVVLGFASLLEDGAFGPLAPLQLDANHKVLTSAERLAALVNDLLDVRRLDTGSMAFRIAPLDLAALLHGAETDIRPLALEKGLAFALELPPNLPSLATDGVRLRQILAHLLDNAVKFTPAGGRIGLKCRVTAGEAGGVAIDIWDTGIGIPEEEQTHLFERFYQVDAGDRRTYGGTGLGLALVKELIVRMGGQIAITSKPGEGSTFSVLLPRVTQGGDDDLIG